MKEVFRASFAHAALASPKDSRELVKLQLQDGKLGRKPSLLESWVGGLAGGQAGEPGLVS